MMSSEKLESLIKKNDLESIIKSKNENEVDIDEVLLYTAKHSNLEIFRWAHLNGAKLTIEVMDTAAEFSDVSILIYIYENIPLLFTEDFLLVIVLRNRKDICKWVIDNRIPIKTSLVNCVARNGNLDMLQYIYNFIHLLFAYNLKFVCFYAAENGHLEILKWALTKNLHWGTSVTYVAAEKGHAEVLKWLLTNGCPWDDSIIKIAIKEKRTDIIEIVNNFAPSHSKNIFLNTLRNRGIFRALGWTLTLGYFYQP